MITVIEICVPYKNGFVAGDKFADFFVSSKKV